MFEARIFIQLKESVLDPQGQTVLRALHDMSFPEVKDVRIGKYIELKLDAESQAEAEEKVEKYCSLLLANPVIESYRFDIMQFNQTTPS